MKSKSSQLRSVPTTSSNFEYLTSQAFFKDRFVPFKEANVSIASSPVLYGLAIYTVFNVRFDSTTGRHIIFRLEDHYKRLVSSAKIMDFNSFEDGWPYQKFKKTILELIRKNQSREDLLVRVTIFVDELIAGTKIHNFKNSLSAYVYPMGEILPKTGAHLGVSSWSRTSDNSIPARAKVNGSYINASLMKNEAILNGYDDAIAIDSQGHVTESTVANIFIVRDEKLITPPVSSDILEGITRDTVINLAVAEGIKAIQRKIDRSELYIADEIFLCGSSARITPVLSIDRRPIGLAKLGKVTARLASLYDRVQLGELAEYKHWLSVV